MTYIQERHDIAITDVGTGGAGTTLHGLMLHKDKGQPVWAVYDGKALAEQFFTGTPSQEYTDPEEEILLSQGPDWRAGFGLTYYNANDPKRYQSSIGADLRFPIGAIAGQLASSAVVKPTTETVPTFLDLPIEKWDDASTPTNWTPAGTVARESGTVHAGTYSAKLTGIAGKIEATTNNWTTDFRNKEYTFRAYVLSSTASHSRIGITDGASTTYSSWHTGGGAWERLSVSQTVAATALTLKVIGIASTAIAGSGFFDSGTVAGSVAASGITVAFAEFNDGLYANFGSCLAKLDAAGTSFSQVGIVDALITDLEPHFVDVDDNLYVACGTAEAPYFRCSTADVLTASTTAVNSFKFFKTVHSAAPTLWGSDSGNSIRSNATPAGASWSGTTKVGSPSYPITSLLQKAGALYIGKEDMPYYLNSAGAVQNDLAPELQTASSATSAKNMKLWKNWVYIPAGSQVLFRTDGTTNEFINPANYSADLADFAGQVMAVAYDEEYLFIAVDNGANAEILAGRDETVDGTTSWRWHPIAEIAIAGVETMFVSTVYQKRLWITSTLASDPIFYIPLPAGYGNITSDANRSFKTATYFTTPFLHGGFKNDKKAFIKIKGTLGHAYDADIYWAVAYKKLADSAWTSIGNIDGSASDRTESLFIPADSASLNPISTMMQFRFTAYTDDTTKTPILVQYTVSAVMYPTIKSIYYAQILCAEDIETKGGVREKNMYDTIITTLDNARNGTWPVSIRDIAGSTRTVKFLPLPRNMPRYIVKRDEKGREIERIYNVMMLEVPLS